MRGFNANDDAERRIISGETWADFCDTLKAAGASVSGMGTPKDTLIQAEGYRYLSRLTRAGLEAFLEFGDPLRPELRRTVHETIKMGADNPDNHYLQAAISGRETYRILGHRGTVHFLGFGTQKGGYGEGRGLPPTGSLDSNDLYVEPDGSLEIIVSTEDPGHRNWLPMEPESGLLIVRQTFLDQATEEPARLRIERIGGDLKRTGVTDALTVDRGLTKASTLVAGAPLLFSKWARDFQRHVNQLPRFDPKTSTQAGGDPEIAYYHSYWRLDPDQALVIEARPPECQNWNFQLNNHWMESLDYRYFRIHLNKHTAVYDDDGSVTIVVAHEDPGHPNWIQTTGHHRGTMCFRWIRAREHPAPKTRVVELDGWRAERS